MGRKRKTDEPAVQQLPDLATSESAPKPKRSRKTKGSGSTEISSQEEGTRVPEENGINKTVPNRRRKQSPPPDSYELHNSGCNVKATLSTLVAVTSASTNNDGKRKRGPVPRKRTPSGDIVPDGSAVCCVCGRVHRARSQDIQRLDLRISIGTRFLSIADEYMCMECISQLPNFLAGALHFAFNMPVEKFKRGFMYPPIELELKDTHKVIK